MAYFLGDNIMGGKYKNAAPCGLVCEECEFYLSEKDISCPGCMEKKGKPFWGECEVYQCNEMQKKEHCGVCKEFPCETIINQFDPKNPRGEEEAIFRIGQLAIRARLSTGVWLKQKQSGELPKFTEK